MVMRDAMDKEDFERRDKGLRPRKKAPKVVMPEPKPPEIKNHIRLDQIPVQDVMGFSPERKVLENEDGVKFIGANVTLNMRDKKPITGWMSEGDMLKLRQLLGHVRRG